MDANSRASQADICPSPKRNAADSSSKEKKILQGRRQQRHSTEIGSEYHRWWVVRSALGFETNEHIAGLLLDGFHGLLQHLVTMCGGEMYQPTTHTEPKLPTDSHHGCEDAAQSPSSSSSTSPPGGIENMGEFLEYRNAISHYCDSLWKMCCQQGSQLQQLDKTSQPVQEFLIRLMGYLRSAKGRSYSLNPKKRRFKSSSVCVRSLAEMNSFPVNLPKLSSLVAQHESQPTDPASNSSPQGAQRVTEDHQGAEDTSSCLEPGGHALQHTGERHYKPDKIPENCVIPENVALEKFPYDDQSSLLQKSKKKEQVAVQPKVSQQGYTHSQTADSRAYEFREPQPNLPKLEQPSQLEPVTEEVLPLNLSASRNLHQGISRQPLQGGHLPQQETSLPRETILQNTQTSTCKRDNGQQQTPRSVSQETDLGNNQTRSLTEQKKFGLWGSDNSLNPGVGLRRDINFTGSPSLNVFGNLTDAAATCDKSAGELGFLLTDALKMLPSIDEEASDLTTVQRPVNDIGYVKKPSSQSDIKINAGLPLTSGRQVQGLQAGGLMPGSSEQLVPCVVGLSGAQSFLGNTQPSVQKVKETQAMGTSTHVYSEIKLNATSNTSHVVDVKPNILVGNSSLQAVHPAVLSGLEKPSPISLGTPVILYPASTFASHDSSLASLSSLVHNIVYNSFGSTLKPLSLTPFTSRCMPYTPPPPHPPMSAGTSDSISQKKSIAAALPVLSSQLSSARPTILPFYISHIADSNLTKLIHPPGLSRISSQPWTNTVTTSTSIDPLATWGSLSGQSQLQNTALPTIHLQPSIPSVSFTNRPPATRISSPTPVAQVRTTGVFSASKTEFAESPQDRKETMLSSSVASTLAKVEYQEEQKIKADSCVQSLPSAPLVVQTIQAVGQPDQYRRWRWIPGTKRAVAAESKCGQTEQSVASCDTNEKAACSATNSGNAGANFHIAEASSEMEASTSSPPGTILNSLLAKKDGKNSRKNRNGGQQIKHNDDAIEDVPEKVDDKTDSHDVDLVSTRREDGQQQRSGTSGTAKKKRRVKDSATTSKTTKPAAVTSSNKFSQRRQLTCPVCATVFRSCMDLLVHRLERHGHVCGECDSRFLTLSRLQQHKDADHPLILICPQCQFHTFRRTELLEHVWSVHDINMDEDDSNKDETLGHGAIGCTFTETACDPEDGFISSSTGAEGDAEAVQEGPNEDYFRKVLEPAQYECSEKQRDGCVKEVKATAATVKESPDAVYHRGHAENYQHCVSDKENQVINGLSLSEGTSLKDLVVTDAEKANSGPVFPSFSREISDVIRSDLDTMSAMFAQVSQYCQLDSSDFLNLSDNPASESEEPRLVIDTEVGCGKDVASNGRDRLKEKVPAKRKKTRPVSLVRHSKNIDKTVSRSFRKRKTSPLTGKETSNFPVDQENVSVKNDIPKIISDVYAKEDEEEQAMDVADGKGKERKRLIMSISLKRQNSTSVYESHTHRRKRRRKRKNIVDSSTDVNVAEDCRPEKIHLDKLHLSAGYAPSCYDLPESSCDQITSSSDNVDNHTRYGARLMDAPKRYSFLPCKDLSFGHPAPLRINLGKDAVDCSRSLGVQSNKLDNVVNDGGDNLQSERALYLRERPVMISLPPKKRKLKRSVRAKDVSSTPDSQCGVADAFKSHEAYAGPLKQGSFSKAEGRQTKEADQITKARYIGTDWKKEETSDRRDEPENSSVHPVDIVESNRGDGESLLAEHNQQLKISGNSVVGGCKGQLFHRWGTKEHTRKPHKTPEISCSVSGCQVKCLNKRELRQHITIEHLGKTRKYMCSWPDCSKGFFARTHLSIHMLTHTGEKPVACDVCDYRCRQRTALIWHLRKHGVFHKTVKVKTRRSSPNV